MGHHSLVLAGVDGRYGREGSEEDSRLHRGILTGCREGGDGGREKRERGMMKRIGRRRVVPQVERRKVAPSGNYPDGR